MTAREQPDQTYYPSCKVRLIVRFDDFGAADTPEPPKKIPTLRAGKGEPELAVVEKDGVLVLEPKSGNQAQGAPHAQTSSQDNRTHVIEGIIPARATLNRNGIRTADTCTIECKFVDLPFDPRVIRACGVEVYMGTLTPDEFRKGIGGVTRADAGVAGNSPGELLNVVPDTYLDPYGNQRSNLRFQGWVDEWETEFPDGALAMVRLECTDNTRLLIEQEAPPKLTIGADEPVDKAVANYLANFPQFRGIAVEYRPAGAEVPKLKDALATTAFKPKLGPAPSGGSSKLSVWDYVTDVCGSIGHTVRFDGVLVGTDVIPTVVIQRARTLYAETFTGRPDDPYTGRILPSGRELTRRLFIFGRNILEMSFRRKFARFAPFNVEVRCYSGKLARTLVARYPMKGDRQKRLLPGDSADQKWVVFRVTGIHDEKVLRAIAQGIYESVGRNELEACFATKSLASFGGGNLDPDALDVLPGDTVDVELNRESDAYATIAGIEEDITTKAEEYIRDLGYSPELAKAYATAVSNVGFPSSFRVRSLVIDWDAEAEGISLDFECVNFLEVRADKALPEGEEIKPEDTAGAKPVRVEVE